MKRDGIDRAGEMAAFAEVASAGSLSAAARALGLTPSAVSRIVARLETRLGVQLIVRTTRSLRLTAEGEAYARSSRRILDDIAESEIAIANQGSPRGRVRVSMAAAHGRLVVVPLLAEFVARHPGVSVDMELSDEVADVMGGRVDLAIRFGPLADSPLTARRLGSIGRSVVASPMYLEQAGRPRSPADLVDHNCLEFSFPRVQAGWPFHDRGEEYLMPVSGNMTANNGETLVQLARDGHGIARVGNVHIQEELQSGRLERLLDAYNPRDTETIHAVFIGGSAVPARVRALVEFLATNMKADRA